MKRIISASYKDDTPAFRSEAFFDDYKRGYAEISSPAGKRRISLRPEDVYAFVFWTKNPSDHFLSHMESLKSPFYLQWTISGYHEDLEPNLPPKAEVIERFKDVSRRLGPERVVLRYDPVLINDRYDVDYHARAFERLLSLLEGYATRVVISFLDEYGKIAPAIMAGEMRAPSLEEIRAVSAFFSESARRHGFAVQTCSEGKYDLSEYGILEGPCVDPDLIERLIGEPLPDEVRTPNSFRQCRCAVNTDIGEYKTCHHGCKYCYAQ